ncbi:MAG: hypothetical protein ACI4D0_00825 [Lachnospira sp.]
MKRIFKFFLIIASIIAIMVIALFIFLIWSSKQPAVKTNYYKIISTDKPLELKYTNEGSFQVSCLEYNSEDDRIGQFKIWYPVEITDSKNTFPLVVMANGTGVPASKYEAIFRHLASWGFIVIGNEDKNSWDGFSSSESLNYALKINDDEDSLFYQKIDVKNIGIAGHSQGGVGAINAVTTQKNGNLYKAIYTASATWTDLADALEWPYDISKVSIPYFYVAGTGKADAETISPLSAMEAAFNEIDNNKLTIMARRKNTDHGEMLAYADGYMTAWFMYLLKDDDEAGEIFTGDNAEILNNDNWQDVKIKHPAYINAIQ